MLVFINHTVDNQSYQREELLIYSVKERIL